MTELEIKQAEEIKLDIELYMSYKIDTEITNNGIVVMENKLTAIIYEAIKSYSTDFKYVDLSIVDLSIIQVGKNSLTLIANNVMTTLLIAGIPLSRVIPPFYNKKEYSDSSLWIMDRGEKVGCSVMDRVTGNDKDCIRNNER